MSYTQAEIIVRYKRMCGYNIFYPMGFDDNGLPTERYVEQTYKIDKRKITRADFRKLCIEETAKGAKVYEELCARLVCPLTGSCAIRQSMTAPVIRRRNLSSIYTKRSRLSRYRAGSVGYAF